MHGIRQANRTPWPPLAVTSLFSSIANDRDDEDNKNQHPDRLFRLKIRLEIRFDHELQNVSNPLGKGHSPHGRERERESTCILSSCQSLSVSTVSEY
jgi:hypothetical protein